jgi:hypothetical protein
VRLARAHDPSERLRAQAANDALVFGTVALATFGSGVLQSAAGWQVVNLAIVPPVRLGLVLVLARRIERSRPAIA